MKVSINLLEVNLHSKPLIAFWKLWFGGELLFVLLAIMVMCD